MTKQKLETQTAMSLHAGVDGVSKEAAVQQLLQTLYNAALEGNVAAAKLYLDYMQKQLTGEPAGITVEEALRIVQEHVTR
jgi:hypothetical protein